MIRGYFGVPGTGKTYLMTQHAQKAGKNRVVYTNYRSLRVPGAKEVVFMKHPIDFINVKEGLVLVDEAGLWMPSFIWKKIPTDLIWKLAQLRKDGLDLYYSAQNPARVVKILREITYESYHMDRFFRLFIATANTGIKDQMLSKQFYWLNKKGTGALYDTYEKVGVISD